MIDLTIENGESPLRALAGLGAGPGSQYWATAQKSYRSKNIKKWVLIGGGAAAVLALVAVAMKR